MEMFVETFSPSYSPNNSPTLSPTESPVVAPTPSLPQQSCIVEDATVLRTSSVFTINVGHNTKLALEAAKDAFAILIPTLLHIKIQLDSTAAQDQ
jgi:hypothetical protein